MSQTDTFQSHAHHTPRAHDGLDRPRLGLVDRLARRAVGARLGQLSAGQVTIHDGTGPSTHGSDPNDREGVIRVRDPRFYRESILGGALGFAESYMSGDWDTPDLTELLRVFVRDMRVTHANDAALAALRIPVRRGAEFLRRNTLTGSRRNIAAHYDLGNEFFALFLDETMTYSSGIFDSERDTMGEASVRKLDRICQRLRLTENDYVLETGTGWGGFALHAARNYGCRVTTTTISGEQHRVAAERIEAAGLADRVTLLLKDYRDLQGQYDKVVSVEMIEAVGHRYLGTYLGACSRLLKPDGQMLMQVITMPDQRYKAYLRTSDFIRKHVFPGSCCPSVGALSDAVRRSTDMTWVQHEDLTEHYAITLERWRLAFEDQIERVRALGYDERFIRMWRYYLSYCIAGFAERYIGVGQILLHKPGCRLRPELPALRHEGTAGALSC